MNKLNVTFYGGVGSVTGANFLCESSDLKFLVDCGLFQGSDEASAENRKDFLYNPATISFLFVTHAHMDHIGRIPKLVRDGFRGVIYSNPVTKSIAEVMFVDALNVMTNDARESGEDPLYSEVDIHKTLSLWKTIDYHQKMNFSEGWQVYTKDAGHILGSTIYEFTHNGQTIVFTGDLGNSPAPLLRDTEDVPGAEYVVMESVYGDRNHESKDERDKKFESILKGVVDQGRTLVIPAFSLERTQVILYEINKLVEAGKLPAVPVFLDSPLAIKITEIYERVSSYYNPVVRKEISGGDDIFNFKKLTSTARVEESKKIDKVSPPKIIIAGSGMSNGGRVVHHEILHLPDPKATILLVGYQALGTLGRQLQDGQKEVSIKGIRVPVKAKIEMIEGYSSHKDSDGLLDFIGGAEDTLKKVFVVMGEPKAGMFLAQRIYDNLNVEAIYPEKGKMYSLDM